MVSAQDMEKLSTMYQLMFVITCGNGTTII